MPTWVSSGTREGQPLGDQELHNPRLWIKCTWVS